MLNLGTTKTLNLRGKPPNPLRPRRKGTTLTPDLAQICVTKVLGIAAALESADLTLQWKHLAVALGLYDPRAVQMKKLCQKAALFDPKAPGLDRFVDASGKTGDGFWSGKTYKLV